VGFQTSGERVTGVRTPSGVVEADTFVLAAGVWSADFGLGLPVAPVKGQIATLRTLNETLRQVVWGGECYLVPRVDGEVILGATQEDGNYDARPTLAGIGALSEAALELLPWAGQLVLEGVWAGLRPAAPDRYPIVGRAPGLTNLYVATAHFRNGVLLGPLTGRLVAQHILTGAPSPELAPFGPSRFLPG
jgi:glycine/D-amino acid oxidase-like deaminating enzyme